MPKSPHYFQAWLKFKAVNFKAAKYLYSALQNLMISWLLIMAEQLVHNQWLLISNMIVHVHMCSHHMLNMHGNDALSHGGISGGS